MGAMVTLKRRRGAAEAPRNTRVRKHARRVGVKRAKNLVMLDDLVVKLEVHAARMRMTPAQVVEGWIELHCKRGADAGAETAGLGGAADAA